MSEVSQSLEEHGAAPGRNWKIFSEAQLGSVRLRKAPYGSARIRTYPPPGIGNQCIGNL